MTRVEKFHDYRQEIAKMKVEDNSLKSKTAKHISEITKNKPNNQLAFDEIMKPVDLFENKSKENKKLYRNKLSLDQFLYGLVAVIVVGLLVTLIIIFA